MITKREELIKKYIEFFKSKQHKEIPSASLIPNNDPTVLFTTAGMHPLVPYLLGQPHPLGKRLVNVQKCIRTADIDQVGDNFHLTFFEMLGNWSLGDYFKKEAIEYSYNFLTKILKIKPEKISVTCFSGDKDAEKDEESAEVWKSLGIKKIKFLPKSDNWWGPAGQVGPCGPDTEMFVNNCEIWNDVFMQYIKDEKGNYNLAKQKNVDTGMGVERTLAILNNLKTVYETSIFQPIIKEIEKLSKKKYNQNEKAFRIIADHIKASVFIIADGIVPSNKEQGYILRRLIRRAINYSRELNIKNFTKQVAEPIFQIYKDYPELKENKKRIIEELEKEESRYNETIEKGFSIFNKLVKDKKEMNCKDGFLLYQSYGFPLELIEEECKKRKIKFSIEAFEKECKIHQETSRKGSESKFKSGLADNSNATKKLHTATHLLNEALRRVLKNPNIKQKGSNITPERLRFDFNFPRKLTPEETKKIEQEVNKMIEKGVCILREELPLEKALKSGAQAEFGAKYPEKVSVYTVENYSREICTGPHVENTSQLGKFKIIKEESVAAGIRRIKAVLE